MNTEEFCRKYEQLGAVYNEVVSMREKITALETAVNNDNTEAYKNALESTFDGVKFVADPDNPFSLTFPMYVKANMFYKHDGNVYVCLQDGIAHGITEGMFEPWEV